MKGSIIKKEERCKELKKTIIASFIDGDVDIDAKFDHEEFS